MSKKRVVFLGSKPIGAFCFQYLLENRELLQIELIAVCTKANALDQVQTVEELAFEHNIPLIASANKIPACDLIISVQHHEILTQSQIDQANQVAVNLHMAPLPEYRGCNQFSFAILDQKNEFGTTLHLMKSGIDNGDIITERRFPIDLNIWVEELYSKTVRESKKLFVDSIKSVIDDSFELISQESLIPERGTAHYNRAAIADIKIIDESWPEEKKQRHVRATFMSGFEPPYSLVNGEKKYYDKDSF